MIRNIIFDWSGTLVNDLPGVWKATNHVLEQAGVPALTLDEFRNEFQLPFTGFYERFTPDIPLLMIDGVLERLDLGARKTLLDFLKVYADTDGVTIVVSLLNEKETEVKVSIY